MTKKALAKILAMLLCLSLLCGCAATPAAPKDPKTEETPAAQTSETAAPEKEEPKETPEAADTQFSVWISTSIDDASEMPICKVLEEATGFAPEYIEISPAAVEEQIQLMWVSGNYPDVIIPGNAVLDDAFLSRYASEGSLLDLAPYMTEENMPNLYKYTTEAQRALLFDSNGSCYAMPVLLNSRIGSGLAINNEWLNALGLDTPETPEELKAVWTAFKNEDPNGNGIADEIPFSTELVWDNALETLNPMFGMFGTAGGWQVDDNGTVIFGQATDDYKEGIKWFRDCYAEGLIDSEIFTQDMTSYKAKAQNDPLLFGSVLAFVYAAYTRSFTEEAGVQYGNLLPMKNSDGDRIWANPSVSDTTVAWTAAVTSACENPEAVCQWFDAMFDPHIGAQIDQAPFGIGVVDNGDGTWDVVQNAQEGYPTYADWRAAMHSNLFPRALTDYAQSQANFVQNVTDVIGSAHMAKDHLYRENCKLTNFLTMDAATEDESTIEATYLNEFTSYWRSTVASWITGNGDVDAEWDAFIKGLNDMGLAELTAAYQARYDRYTAK